MSVEVTQADETAATDFLTDCLGVLWSLKDELAEAFARHRSAEPKGPAEASGLVERLNERVGGVSTPRMEGDNLAILLCGHFDNPDQEPEDDTGWTPDGVAGHDEVLAAIREHYRPALDARDAEIAALKQEIANLKDAGDRLYLCVRHHPHCTAEVTGRTDTCGADAARLSWANACAFLAR